jgi:hypothetical protein
MLNNTPPLWLSLVHTKQDHQFPCPFQHKKWNSNKMFQVSFLQVNNILVPHTKVFSEYESCKHGTKNVTPYSLGYAAFVAVK